MKRPTNNDIEKLIIHIGALSEQAEKIAKEQEIQLYRTTLFRQESQVVLEYLHRLLK